MYLISVWTRIIIFIGFIFSALPSIGQCDATFDYYDNILRRASNTSFKPVIIGDHGGVFTSSPSGLVFNDINTGEIGLSSSTPENIYTITYTVGACSHSQDIVIFSQGTNFIDLCGDTLTFPGNANCEAPVSYAWHPGILTAFNLVGETGPSNGSLVPLGLDSVIGHFNWPKQYNLITENNWQPTSNPNDQKGVVPIIHSPNYNIASTGGIVVEGSGNDGLRMTVPMENRTFNGIDISFDFRMNYDVCCAGTGYGPTYNTLFSLGDDTYTCLQLSVNPFTGLGYSINLKNPDDSIEDDIVILNIDPSEDSYNNYRVVYDPETGLFEMFANGGLFYFQNYTPGAVLNYLGGDYNVGSGVIIDSEIDGYGLTSDISSFNNLSITEIILEKNRNCKKYLEVEDSTPPLINCSVINGYNFELNGACDFVLPNFFDSLQFIEDCEVDTASFVQNPPPGTLVGTGPVNITFNIDDKSGNAALPCSSTVYVVDNTAPVILCNTDSIFIYSSDGIEEVPNLEFKNPVINFDGCDIYNYTQFPNAGDFIGYGNHSVFQIVNDAVNLSNSCEVIVSVIEFDFECVNDTVIYADADNCGSNFSYSLPTGAEFVAGLGSGAFFNEGTHIETIMFSNNDTLILFDWNNSAQMPNIPKTGPSASAYNSMGTYAPNGAGHGLSFETWEQMEYEIPSPLIEELENIEIGFEYRALGNSKILSHDKIEIEFFNSDIQLYYFLDDFDSNGGIQTYNIPSVVPDITNLHSYVFQYDDISGIAEFFVDGSSVWQSPATPNRKLDLTGGSPVLLIGDGLSGNGTEVVIDEFYISAFSPITCDFQVTVLDTISPVVICPTNEVLQISNSTCDATYNWTVPATDNCGIDTQYFFDEAAVYTSGSALSVGSYVFSVNTADVNGNQTYCSWNVDVEDNIAPQISCATDDYIIWSETGSSIMPDLTYLADVTILDGCYNYTVSQSPAVGESISTSDTQVILMVSDDYGNGNDCSFPLIWMEPGPFSLTCPGNIAADNNANPTGCSTIVNFAEPTSDNGTVIQNSTEGNGDTFMVDSIYTLEYQVEPIIETILSYSWDNSIAPLNSADEGPNATSWAGSANYVTDPSGGNYIHSNGALDFNYPIDLIKDLEGIEIGFEYAADFSRNAKMFVANWDLILDVDSNFYVRYHINLPGGGTQLVEEIEAFLLPMDDQLHEYLFRYDNRTGICQVFLDGAEVWTNPNPIPNTSLAFPFATDFNIGTATNGTDLIMDDFYIRKYTSNPSCSFEIDVADVIDPVIIDCPSNVTMFTSVVGCDPIYSYTVQGFDLCGDVSYTQLSGLPQLGAVYPVGTTQNSWLIQDQAGNSQPCYFEVELIEDTAPTVTCPDNITQVNDPGLCGALINFNVDTQDNCSGLIGVLEEGPGNISTGGLFPIGTHTNTYTYQQGSLSDNCQFTVTIIDNEYPVFTEIPDSDTLYVSDTSCEVSYTYSITGIDNCAGYTINPTSSHPANLSPDIYNYSYDIMDANGNTVSANWEIVVLDTISPAFTECPADYTVYSPDYDCGDVVSYLLEYEDNCTAQSDIELTQISGGLNDQYWPLGSFEQLYEIKDESGNASYCEFTVLVVDTISPSIDCPENQTLFVENGICGRQFDYDIEIGDNCALSNSENMISGLPSESIFPIGVTEVEFEIVDVSLNDNQCSFSVTVFDNQAPTFDCPPSETITIEADTCVAYFEHDLAIQENCSVFTISNGVSEFIQDTLIIGLHAYDFTVSDNYGNSNDCNFEIEVVDETAPNFSCEDVYVEVNENCEYLIPDFSLDPSLYDCSGLESFTQTPLPGEVASGTTLVIASFTDNLGNFDNCAFELFGVDSILPTAENCLNDTTIYSLANDCGNYFYYSINPTDNCGIQDSVINGALSGEFLTIGVHNIEFIYWDNSSLQDTCSFNVTVVDNVVPTFDCNNVIVIDANDDCQEQATFTLEAEDNCGIAEINQLSGPISGSVFPAGETEISYEAVDIYGNRDTCSFYVIVQAGLNWTIDCPGDQTVPADNSCNYVLQDYTSQASLLDTCNNLVTFTQEPMPGSTQSGTTEVTIFGTDSYGTVKPCTFNIIPEDLIPPVINCSQDTTIYVLPGHCKAIFPYEWDASDGCSVDNIEFIGYSPNDSIPIGNNPIEIVAFDGNLNSDSCSFNVTVLDTIAPVLFCDPVIIVDADGNCEQQINFSLDAEDNCQIVSIQQISGPLSGDVVPVGEYVIEYSATDIYNNSDTCDFVLTVQTNESWTFECPENDTIYIQSVCEIDILNYTEQVEINATCTDVFLEQFPSSGTITESTTFEITATDENNNTQSCFFDVVLIDTIIPSIEISLLNIAYDSLTCGALVEYDINAEDNCGTPTFTMLEGLASGSVFPVGNTLLVYEAIDPIGNTHIDSLDISVTDNYIPFISCETYLEFCDTNLTIETPIVSDACGIDDLFNSFNGSSDASGVYPTGTSFINWTVRDVNGNENNCFQEIFVEGVQDAPNAGMDQTVLFDNQVELAADAVSNGIGAWQQISGEGIIQDFNNPNTNVSDLSYGLNEFVWVADYTVCDNQSDTLAVNVLYITAPNGISPDGDGINDALVIEGLDYFAENVLHIYNRWGQLVCVRENYQNDWTGKNTNGIDLPNDTYFYTLEVKEYNKSYNGFVVIKR